MGFRDFFNFDLSFIFLNMYTSNIWKNHFVVSFFSHFTGFFVFTAGVAWMVPVQKHSSQLPIHARCIWRGDVFIPNSYYFHSVQPFSLFGSTFICNVSVLRCLEARFKPLQRSTAATRVYHSLSWHERAIYPVSMLKPHVWNTVRLFY